MLNISVYVKDLNYDPSSYYRIIQYISKFVEHKLYYHPQLSEKQYLKYMPISKQNIFIKVYLQIFIMLKMLFSLINDLKNKVDVVIISRRIINICFPRIYMTLLRKIKNNGAKIYWDFDDHIIESKETSKKSFDFFSEISDIIIVTHIFLKELVVEKYRKKVELLPTTDGDIYSEFNETVNIQREKLLESEIDFIWVGTSVNLQYLLPLVFVLDKISLNSSKKFILNVVCNEPVIVKTECLIIKNIKWSRKVAIETMLKSHIGLMPLVDSDFAKGKGGFKLVQYLSASLPIIGSNVGFNKDVCDNDVGQLLDDIYNKADLNKSINYILCNWPVLSKNAFKKWTEKFSFDETFLFWKKLVN